MKKTYLLMLFSCLAISLTAEVPQYISYQSLLRDASGVLLRETEVGIRISIIQGTPDGIAIYEETHKAVTNINGLISIQIGNGTTNDDFTLIDWSSGSYFIKSEVDLEGGTNYSIESTIQLVTVPYAFHAESANNFKGSFIDLDSLKVGFIQSDSLLSEVVLADTLIGGIKEYDPVFISSVASKITQEDTTNWNNKLDKEEDGDAFNEMQNFIVSTLGDTLFLSGSNWVIIPGISEANKEQLEGTVTDIDGNTYKTVKIGDQWWMAENLKVTKFPDGTSIPLVLFSDDWKDLEDNDDVYAYTYYNLDLSLGYGALYTYGAATKGDNSGIDVQGACPDGWHLPSEAEWDTLINHFEWGKSGVPLSNTSGWQTSEVEDTPGYNQEENNISGFTALSAGYRHPETGLFDMEGYSAMWWVSTQHIPTGGFMRIIRADRSDLSRCCFHNKSAGLSIRCIKD